MNLAFSKGCTALLCQYLKSLYTLFGARGLHWLISPQLYAVMSLESSKFSA